MDRRVLTRHPRHSPVSLSLLGAMSPNSPASDFVPKPSLQGGDDNSRSHPAAPAMCFEMRVTTVTSPGTMATEPEEWARVRGTEAIFVRNDSLLPLLPEYF